MPICSALELIISQTLRVIYGRVSTYDNVLYTLFSSKHGYSDTQASNRFCFGCQSINFGTLKFFDEHICDLLNFLFISNIWKDDSEFISPISSNKICNSDIMSKNLCDCLEDTIADKMSALIIDFFERIHIDEHKSAFCGMWVCCISSLCYLKSLKKVIIESSSISDASKFVSQTELMELFDIGNGNNHSRIFSCDIILRRFSDDIISRSRSTFYDHIIRNRITNRKRMRITIFSDFHILEFQNIFYIFPLDIDFFIDSKNPSRFPVYKNIVIICISIKNSSWDSIYHFIDMFFLFFEYIQQSIEKHRWIDTDENSEKKLNIII